MYSFGIIFFLLFILMHASACNARHLGFVSEEIGNGADFLAKDVNKLKFHDQLEIRPSILKQAQTQELREDGVHGRRIQENLIGATMKQTLFNSLLKAKAISSGYIISSGADFNGMEKVEGLKRVVTRSRSMLGDSGGDTEEHVDFKEKDNGDDDMDFKEKDNGDDDMDFKEKDNGDDDMDFKEKDNGDDDMDYSQPRRKPPIHNEKN